MRSGATDSGGRESRRASSNSGLSRHCGWRGNSLGGNSTYAHFEGGRVIILVMDQFPDMPPEPAEYYRRKAARARQVAEGVTTRAIKARLLELALEYDRLADGTATRVGPASDLPDL